MNQSVSSKDKEKSFQIALATKVIDDIHGGRWGSWRITKKDKIFRFQVSQGTLNMDRDSAIGRGVVSNDGYFLLIHFQSIYFYSQCDSDVYDQESCGKERI